MFKQVFIAAFLIAGMASSALAQSSSNCDRVLDKIRRGTAITEADRLACRKELCDYYDSLSARHGVRWNFTLPEPDRTLFYVKAIKTGIIDPAENGGWAFRSMIRSHVLDQLRVMISATNDPFLVFCAIFPALHQGNTNYAAECFETLKEHDAFLADLTVRWSSQYYSNPDWLLTHYLDNGQQAKAREVADMAAATGLAAGLEVKCHLLDELGEYTRAEACGMELEERHHYVGALVRLYRRHGDQKDGTGTTYRQRYDDLTKRYFPNGLRKFSLPEPREPPFCGVIFAGDSDTMHRCGLNAGMVICALDGYQIEDLAQYFFVREMDSANPRMHLIVWNGSAYLGYPIKIDNRRFGVELKDYAPETDMEKPDTAKDATSTQRRRP